MKSLSKFRGDFFAPVEDEFNRLFDRFFGPDSLHSVRSRGRSGYPKLDVLETDKEYVVEAEVPGVDPDYLTVEIVPYEATDSKAFGVIDPLAGRKVLKLSGKKDFNYQYPEGTAWHVKEVRRSQFTRELMLPDYIETDPKAVYERGILKLVWSKPEIVKRSDPKQIPITKKA
jgi:HSP20 family protein